jgi:dGTPase
MEEFIASVNNDLPVRDQRNKKSNKVRQILPGKASEEQTCNEKYLNTLRVLDYLSGMTDSYAVTLFRQIQGIALPGNR